MSCAPSGACRLGTSFAQIPRLRPHDSVSGTIDTAQSRTWLGAAPSWAFSAIFFKSDLCISRLHVQPAPTPSLCTDGMPRAVSSFFYWWERECRHSTVSVRPGKKKQVLLSTLSLRTLGLTVQRLTAHSGAPARRRRREINLLRGTSGSGVRVGRFSPGCQAGRERAARSRSPSVQGCTKARVVSTQAIAPRR